MEVTPIRVEFLGLPVVFWTMEALRKIGNALGTFYEANMSFEMT
jgi:hypothetical protein